MPKELLIMRHAKSSWSNAGQTDHDRPLNDRGLRDAPRMATCLSNNQLTPDLVLSSSAIRARTTANMLNSKFDVQLDIREDFYLASPDVYVETIRELDDKFDRPMVVGHNPGLEQLVYALTGDDEFMSTAAIAHVEIPIESWSEFDLSASKCRLKAVYRPKEIEC